MSKTTIEWTERTWNPVRGCSPVSPGCANCYAERQGGRFCGPGRPFDGFIQIGKNGNPGPHWTGKVELIEHMLDVPLRTRKPTTWFVNSMSDLFHEALADHVIDRVFAVMALCPQHTFQVLTKRSKRLREYMAMRFGAGHRGDKINELMRNWHPLPAGRGFPRYCEAWPLPNVWLGVSVEDQQRADERIPDLVQTPAAVRFLSAEPLLGPVDLTRVNYTKHLRETLVAFARWSATKDGRDPEAEANRAATCVTDEGLPDGEKPRLNVLTGEWFDGWDSGDDGKKLDWVIVGGESGPGARPFDLAWARGILKQCRSANVPCFVKQVGALPIGSLNPLYESQPLKLNSKKGGDMAEWPADLRVRQTPNVAPRPVTEL